MIGQTIANKYEVIRLIGKGGMGCIYLAKQVPLGRMVALKVLRPRCDEDELNEGFQKRFLIEASTYAKLTHPNTVTIHDYGKLDGFEDQFYMAMEFVDGQTLSTVLRQSQVLAPRRALQISYEICRSLREAHGHGIIHRDLKPSNVMLVQTDEGESVKVLDFGIARVLKDRDERLTETNVIIGSPEYMSPEQIRSNTVDGRSDIYALGILLYKMLCGKVPFSSEEAVQSLMAHVLEPVPSFWDRSGVHIAPEIDQLVMRCLEKKPDARFRDVQTLMTAIESVLESLGAQSHPNPLKPAFEQRPPSNAPTIGTLAALREPTTPPLAEGAPSPQEPRKLSGGDTEQHFQPLAGAAALEDSPSLQGSKSKKIWLVLLIVIPILSVATYQLVHTLQGDAKDRVVIEPKRTPADDSAQKTPSAPPAPPPVAPSPTFRIHSAPPGARVMEGDTLLGHTPLEMPFQTTGKAPKVYELRLVGYEAQKISPQPIRSGDVVFVRLIEQPAPPASKKPQKRAPKKPQKKPAKKKSAGSDRSDQESWDIRIER